MWNDEVPSTIDPIIELMQHFQADSRLDKVNLGVGVYQDDQGKTPVFKAVKQAELALVDSQPSKDYVGVGGSKRFVSLVGDTLFPKGDLLWEGIQAVGGSGALRLIADFCARVSPTSRIWISDPSWPNHLPLFSAAKLQIEKFDYTAFGDDHLVDRVMNSFSRASEGDFVVLHACCHNPTGIDLSAEDNQKLLAFLKDKKLVPIFDAAYLGFKRGFKEDAEDLARSAAQFDVAFCAFSASKSFGVYRERVGITFLLGRDREKLQRWHRILLQVARATYSMPPDHGAAVLELVLSDATRRQLGSMSLKPPTTDHNAAQRVCRAACGERLAASRQIYQRWLRAVLLGAVEAE